MRRATEERGGYIDQLGEQMNQASVSAANYLNQARNNAVSPVRLAIDVPAQIIGQRGCKGQCEGRVLEVFLGCDGTSKLGLPLSLYTITHCLYRDMNLSWLGYAMVM